MNKSISRCFAFVGFLVGRTVSTIPSLGHLVVGRVLDRWVSSRVQRFAFLAFARLNAVYCFLAIGALAFILAVLFPAQAVSPMSLWATGVLLLPCVVLQSMYYRLGRGKASMLVTSCYGRELRVHLPKTELQMSDASEFRAQVADLVGIAIACHAQKLTFRSPLLASGTTSALLRRQLAAAARAAGVAASVTVFDPEEVSAVSGGTLSVFSRKYADLRDGRLAVGEHGRLMSRKVQVIFQ